MWRQAGPWGQPLTTSETSTSTKDSSLSLQLALRGTVCHCGSSRPPSTLDQPVLLTDKPSPTTLPHSPRPSSFPTPQHPANTPRTVEKKKWKSLYFYKASYFYCMLSSLYYFFCKTFTFLIPYGCPIWKVILTYLVNRVEVSLEAIQPILACWWLLWSWCALCTTVGVF